MRSSISPWRAAMTTITSPRPFAPNRASDRCSRSSSWNVATANGSRSTHRSNQLRSVRYNPVVTADELDQQAVAAGQANRFDEAERLLRAAIEIEPNHPRATLNLA